MKIIKKVFLLIKICLIIFSCKNENLENDAKYIIRIPNKEISKTMNPINIIDTTLIIKLETKKECVIGQVSKILIHKNSILVLDSFVSKGLFKFDLNGNFLYRIGNVGKGPGEYSFPSTFSIDRKKDEIYIYDRFSKDLIIYDFNGNFIDDLSLDIRINDFSISNNGEILLDCFAEKQKDRKRLLDQELYSLYIYDTEGIYSHFDNLKFDKKQLNLSIRSFTNFHSFNSNIFYNKPFENTIFKITNKESQPYFKFIFDEKPLPDSSSFNISLGDFLDMIQKQNFEYFNNLNGYFTFDHSLIFSIARGSINEQFIYDMDSQKLHKLPERNLSNLGKSFYGVQSTTYLDYLVCYLKPEWIEADLQGRNGKENKLFDYIENLEKGDNPIILLNKVKKVFEQI